MILISGLRVQSEKDAALLEPWLVKKMDACISDIFLHQEADSFVQLFNLILNENISGIYIVHPLKNYIYIYTQTHTLSVI